MCENGFVVGSVKMKDVWEGAELGIVMQGAPVGITPKSWGSGSAILLEVVQMFSSIRMVLCWEWQ